MSKIQIISNNQIVTAKLISHTVSMIYTKLNKIHISRTNINNSKPFFVNHRVKITNDLPEKVYVQS